MNYHEILKAVVFCVIMFIFVGFFFLFTQVFSNNLGEFYIWKTNKGKSVFQGSLAGSFENSNAIPQRKWEVGDLENVLAQSAISVETGAVNKVLFKKDENKILPIASLTKLMTAMVVLQNYDLEKTITINKGAVLQEGEQGALKAGDSLSVKNLIYIMLIESSNHAAYALAENMGVQRFVYTMNEQAKKLGLQNTYYADPTGLSAENHSTAQDLAKLTDYLLKNYPIIVEISKTKEFDLYKPDGSFYAKLTNTNKLLGEIPEVVGGKTGFTTDAKGCLMLVIKNQKDNSYLINVILGSDDRFGEMKKIIDWVNNAFKW